MKKMNLLLLFLLLSVCTACKKDIYEGNIPLMSIEQFSPVMENGVVKLSGKVSLPKELNRETAKVGFFVRRLTTDMRDIFDGEFWSGGSSPYDAYLDFKSGYEYNNNETSYLWVDQVSADGTFSVPFVPQMQQYMCVAFVLNVLDDTGYYNTGCQILNSEPYFFTAEATVKLELVDPLRNEFRLTHSGGDMSMDIGLCWSYTHTLPDMEDYGMVSYFVQETDSVTFDYIDFGNNETVYLRGFARTYIDGYHDSYKVIYSDVLEFHPKEQVVDIHSKEDLHAFLASMYEYQEDAYGTGRYEYFGDKIWEIYHGQIKFHYEVKDSDWVDPISMQQGYFPIRMIQTLNATLQGSGVLPGIRTVSESGKVIGMSLPNCDVNNGVLENVDGCSLQNNNGRIEGGSYLDIFESKGVISSASYIHVTNNYGEVLDSDHISIDRNYGFVHDCKEVYGDEGYYYYNSMVEYNQSEGRIVNCSISEFSEGYNHLICRVNYGYMENCLPDSACCTNNHGVIQNPPTNGNAGGGIVEGE